VVPVALLVLRNGGNLFVDDRSDRDGRYIPHFFVDTRFFAENSRPASGQSASTRPIKASMIIKAKRCLQWKKPPRYFSRR
jgi:hypothetical protein